MQKVKNRSNKQKTIGIFITLTFLSLIANLEISKIVYAEESKVTVSEESINVSSNITESVETSVTQNNSFTFDLPGEQSIKACGDDVAKVESDIFKLGSTEISMRYIEGEDPLKPVDLIAIGYNVFSKSHEDYTEVWMIYEEKLFYLYTYKPMCDGYLLVTDFNKLDRIVEAVGQYEFDQAAKNYNCKATNIATQYVVDNCLSVVNIN